LSEQDLVVLAKARIKTTEDQLARLKTFYDAETGNPAEYHDLQGQLAADLANLAENRNTLKSSILGLNTLVNSNEKIAVAPLNNKLELEKYPYSADEVYAQALNVFPTIKSNELSLASAEKGVSIARSQFTPEISFFAGLNTNFSSAARLFNETGSNIVGTNDYVSVNNQDYQVLSNQVNYSSLEIPYRDQFENNLNSSFGIAVTIPILNGFRAKNNVTLQKIRQNEALTAVQQTKLDLKEAIGQSYNAMQSAFERYQLLQDQVNAYRESFRINEIRFNSGVSNSVDYLNSKNNIDNAAINLSNVRYAYTLRAKVLEYYRVGL
jgi:outer membrane protein